MNPDHTQTVLYVLSFILGLFTPVELLFRNLREDS